MQQLRLLQLERKAHYLEEEGKTEEAEQARTEARKNREVVLRTMEQVSALTKRRAAAKTSFSTTATNLARQAAQEEALQSEQQHRSNANAAQNVRRTLFQSKTIAAQKVIIMRRLAADRDLESEEVEAEAARLANEVQRLTSLGDMARAAELAAMAEKARAKAAAARAAAAEVKASIDEQEAAMQLAENEMTRMDKELEQGQETVKQVSLRLGIEHWNSGHSIHYRSMPYSLLAHGCLAMIFTPSVTLSL